ncbi:class I SAM-dependent methyltransferase [Haloarcula litorea]|uniref:class I SAM-dependent methyltransferase n=1 Tax=Haloarcula litorea TaxID=3032579 RepID=UPI0023E843E6|nr:class I SAM-dependent methyltransferase [Halomicroarcula sp. GDY20]
MVEKDAVRRSYDELADAYAAERDEDDEGMTVLRAFRDGLGAEPRVLDAGCGQGSPVLAELTASATAVGLDFSREQLRRAAENAPDAALSQGDLTRLPLADDAFDAVVAYWSLIHVPLAEHGTVIDEFARVLRPGGRALVCEGASEWVGENPDWLDSGTAMAWEIAGPEATREQLRDAGFRIVEEWGAADSLADEDDGEDPWTFFAAALADS